MVHIRTHSTTAALTKCERTTVGLAAQQQPHTGVAVFIRVVAYARAVDVKPRKNRCWTVVVGKKREC